MLWQMLDLLLSALQQVVWLSSFMVVVFSVDAMILLWIMQFSLSGLEQMAERTIGWFETRGVIGGRMGTSGCSDMVMATSPVVWITNPRMGMLVKETLLLEPTVESVASCQRRLIQLASLL